MDTIQQQKAALRREPAAAERTMMPEEKRLSDSAILHRVLNTQEYRRAHTVFAFVGRADEIDTRPCWSRYWRTANGCAYRTPEVVKEIRAKYPTTPLIASGGKTNETVHATIQAGANSIT